MLFTLFIVSLIITALVLAGRPLMRYAFVIGSVLRKVTAVLWLVLLGILGLICLVKLF